MSVQIPVSSPGAEQTERQLAALDAAVEGLEDKQMRLERRTNNARQSVDRFGQDVDIAASSIREAGDEAGGAAQDVDAFAQAMISASRQGNQGLLEVAGSVENIQRAFEDAEGDAQQLEAILGPGGAFTAGAAEADRLGDRLRAALQEGDLGSLATGDVNLGQQLVENLQLDGGSAQAEAQAQGSALGTGIAVATGQAFGDVLSGYGTLETQGFISHYLSDGGEVPDEAAKGLSGGGVLDALADGSRPAAAGLRNVANRLRDVTGIDLTGYVDDGIAVFSRFANSSGTLTSRLGGAVGSLRTLVSAAGVASAAVAAVVTIITAAAAAASNLANQLAQSSVELEQVVSQTGVAREELALFAEVLRNQNPEADVRDLADVFSELQQSITEAKDPTTEQARLFDELGLSAERLAGLPLTDAFAEISDRVSTLNAESKLLAARLTVGEEGARQLARSFGLTSEELARLQARVEGGVLDEEAQQSLVGLSDSVSATNSQVSRLGEELAAVLGPPAARVYGAIVDVLDPIVQAFTDLLSVITGIVGLMFGRLKDAVGIIQSGAETTRSFVGEWEFLDNLLNTVSDSFSSLFRGIKRGYTDLINFFAGQDDFEVISATPGQEAISIQDEETTPDNDDADTPLLDAIRARREAIDDANDEFERELIDYEDLLNRLEAAELQLFEDARDAGADATTDAAAQRVLAIRRQIEALGAEVDALPSSLGIDSIQGQGLQAPPSTEDLFAQTDEFGVLQDELAIINEFFAGQERLQRRIRTIENARIRFAREGVELSQIEELVLDTILQQNRERLEQLERLSAEEQERLQTLNNIADRLSEDLVGNLFDSLVDSSQDFGEALRDAGISALRDIVTSAAADAFRRLLSQGESEGGFFSALGALGSNKPDAKGAGDKAKAGKAARTVTPGQTKGLTGTQSAAAGTAGTLAGQGVQAATGSKLLGGLAGGVTAAGTAALLGAGPLGIALLAAGGLLGGLFANGGRPPKGKASIVGERGPELFVPDNAGTIIPNEALQPSLPEMPGNGALINEVRKLRSATEAALSRPAQARIARKDFREAETETRQYTRQKNARNLRN